MISNRTSGLFQNTRYQIHIMGNNYCRFVALILGTMLLAACVQKQSNEREPETQVLVQATELDRDAVNKVLDIPDDCEDAFRLSYASDGSGVEMYALSADMEFYSVLCSAGAYQPSFSFFLRDAKSSKTLASPLEFIVWESEDGETLTSSKQTELWGETLFDAKSRRLDMLSVSRQSRDCGSWATYRIENKKAHLIAVWALLPCPSEPGTAVSLENGSPPLEWVKVQTENPDN